MKRAPMTWNWTVKYTSQVAKGETLKSSGKASSQILAQRAGNAFAAFLKRADRDAKKYFPDSFAKYGSNYGNIITTIEKI